MQTQARFFAIPPASERALHAATDSEEAYLGALHAVEHGIISLFPLELLCDRRDIGGLSTPLHTHTGRSTVFIHDGHPGGVGLAKGGYNAAGRLLNETREMIDGCPCTSGCPSCIQSPHCRPFSEP